MRVWTSLWMLSLLGCLLVGGHPVASLENIKSPNFYERLGLPNDATPQQIRVAYRRLAKKYHPDAGGTEQAMQALSEAYQALVGKPVPRSRVKTASQPQSTAADHIYDGLLKAAQELERKNLMVSGMSIVSFYYVVSQGRNRWEGGPIKEIQFASKDYEEGVLHFFEHQTRGYGPMAQRLLNEEPLNVIRDILLGPKGQLSITDMDLAHALIISLNLIPPYADSWDKLQKLLDFGQKLQANYSLTSDLRHETIDDLRAVIHHRIRRLHPPMRSSKDWQTYKEARHFLFQSSLWGAGFALGHYVPTCTVLLEN